MYLKAEKTGEAKDDATPEPPRKEWRPDQEAVVDPSDPEVQAAATRIQAGFKGMQARRRCDEMKRVRKITLEDVYGGGEDEGVGVLLVADGALVEHPHGRLGPGTCNQ